MRFFPFAGICNKYFRKIALRGLTVSFFLFGSVCGGILSTVRIKEALIQSLSYFVISIMMQDKEKDDANNEAI